MHVLLVGPDQEYNLSLGYLASSLQRAGHSAEIVAFDSESDAPSVLRRARDADAVGLSMCFQVRAREFLRLARALKEACPRLPIIAGGHFATCAAADLLRDNPQMDVIVMHEGERALVELCDKGDRMIAAANEVAGVVYREGGEVRATMKRPILRDLDGLPPPDRSGPSRIVAGVPTAYVMGSRGCIRSCDYCCITTLHRTAPGPRFRQREPEKVVEELAELYHERGVRQFVFHDDNFLVPRPSENQRRLDRYHRAMQAAGMEDIGLLMKCGPQDLDEEALKKLVSMGLLRLFLGIESSSECGLDSIGRRQTPADVERAVSLCEKYGVSSQFTMIIFNPDATIESMLEDLAFVERHPAHPINYCRAEIYAGTPLEQRMLNEGRAYGDYMGRAYHYTDPRVARVWGVARDVFAARAWGTEELLGQAIRVDHQATVLRHFYEGPEIDAVVRDFLAWEARMNLDTAGLFREVVVACGEAESDDCPELRDRLGAIRCRELSNRLHHVAELGRLQARIDACVHPVLRLVQAPRPARLPARLPRHTLALLVAAGIWGSSCSTHSDGGVTEAAAPPLTGSANGPPPKASGTLSATPPTDAGAPDADAGTPSPDGGSAAPPDAGSPPPDAGTDKDAGAGRAKPPHPPPPPPPPLKRDPGVNEFAALPIEPTPPPQPKK